MALAKLQEDKLRDHRQTSSRPHPSPSPLYNPPNTSQKQKPTYVQRTPDEIALRREKGLCYNCDEKWSSSHRCKGRVLLFIADNSDEPTLDTPSLDMEPPTPLTLDPDTNPPHISLHALSGLHSSETFRLNGIINHTNLTILIDSGSTHNFLQPRIAQFLRLKPQSTSPLHVLVGNGSVLDCNQVCPETSLSLQGH